jgi:hypothetical protein
MWPTAVLASALVRPAAVLTDAVPGKNGGDGGCSGGDGDDGGVEGGGKVGGLGGVSGEGGGGDGGEGGGAGGGGEGEGEGGGGGEGGEGGGEGGEGGGGGGDGCEHTRQPEETYKLSVDHSIVPGPKIKLEGPPPPWKAVNVPDGWEGMRRTSPLHSLVTVLKEVAVRGLPMASAVGVMEHAWLFM